MGLLDYADAAREKLKGLLGGMPIVQMAQGKAEMPTMSGLLATLKAMPVFSPDAGQSAYEAAMQIGPMGLGIVRPAVARTLNTKTALPASPEFSAAVANTPGASIAEDGLLMRVARGQLPEQGLTESVRGGVFYLPEGAAQMKHYSTGRNGYGGTERISGETLVKNPLFAKGGTGGKAPEAAYDSLMGKGAYQSMRGEALKAYGGYGDRAHNRAALADEFLDKYAPEMSGMGGYIVSNSGKGNQLAYALQEAAVSSAVRKAGHDAVLGYSKGKKGPFISELFDVRESHYPDKFGGYRIFPEFGGN